MGGLYDHWYLLRRCSCSWIVGKIYLNIKYVLNNLVL